MMHTPPSANPPVEIEGALLVDAETASRMLGVAVQTLARWRTEGRAPRFAKIGRAVRYSRRELEEFIAARMRTSTTAPVPSEGP